MKEGNPPSLLFPQGSGIKGSPPAMRGWLFISDRESQPSTRLTPSLGRDILGM